MQNSQLISNRFPSFHMKFFLTGLGNLYENTESITKGIIAADQHGFSGALMPDHYMWGNEIGHKMENPYVTLETWTYLTYIAGKTENIHLGTLVTPLPFRHPGVLAKRLSTLDNLSRGRVILGLPWFCLPCFLFHAIGCSR